MKPPVMILSRHLPLSASQLFGFVFVHGVGVFEQLIEGGEDDFNILLYIFRCCQRSRDPRTWCREFFVHQRVLRSGELPPQRSCGLPSSWVKKNMPGLYDTSLLDCCCVFVELSD